jgi:hypothetical protein
VDIISAAPLQICVTSPSQLSSEKLYALADAAIAALPSSCCVVSGGRVLIGALTESNLESATSLARKHILDLRLGPIEVTYFDTPNPLEPYYRAVVTSPEDYYGDVIGDLSRRRGWIEALNRVDDSFAIKCAVPIATMIGYDSELSRMTRGSGSAEYAFIGYFQRAREPEPPLPPAVAVRA